MIKKGLENQRKNLQELELINEKKQKELTELKRLKRAKGITLIALIITIIILIILAGITLVALSGENGILRQASKAKEETAKAEEKEKEDLKELEQQILLNTEVWNGTVGNSYAGGTGSKEDPYLIENGEQLAYLAEQVNNGEKYTGKYFKIIKSINLGGAKWTPIGKKETDYETDVNWDTDSFFNGEIDGQGNIIANISVYEQTDAVGLIGVLGESGVIKNLKISSGKIEGNARVGSFIGIKKGTIKNCINGAKVIAYVDKNEKKGFYAGGIVGFNQAGDIEGLDTIGGIVGGNYGSIESAYNSGKINSVDSMNTIMGGIVGINESENDVVKYSYNKGIITGGGSVGGIIGENLVGTVEECFYYSDTLTKGVGSQDTDVAGETDKVDDNINSYEEFLTWIETKK